MSFVPAPQAPSSSNANNNGQVTKAIGGSTAVTNASSSGAVTPEPAEISDYDLLFKLRTFDVYWVEKKALMYKDGFDKVSAIQQVLYVLPFVLLMGPDGGRRTLLPSPSEIDFVPVIFLSHSPSYIFLYTISFFYRHSIVKSRRKLSLSGKSRPSRSSSVTWRHLLDLSSTRL